MIAVIQRVSKASVTIKENVISSINAGLLVLLGVQTGDTAIDADFLARKISELRIFSDDKQQMNRSIIDVAGEVLVVSQFTLLADCSRGRRPGFSNAAAPEDARILYEHFTELIRRYGISTGTGAFGQMMQISLVNEGPVTIILDSRLLNRRPT